AFEVGAREVGSAQVGACEVGACKRRARQAEPRCPVPAIGLEPDPREWCDVDLDRLCAVGDGVEEREPLFARSAHDEVSPCDGGSHDASRWRTVSLVTTVAGTDLPPMMRGPNFLMVA